MGVIGLGVHGLTQIAQLQRNPVRWSVAAVSDASMPAFARFQPRYHDRRIPAYRDPADLIANQQFDAVLVSTTAPSHVALAQALIAAGHRGCILLEKPVSNRLSSAQALMDFIAEAEWPGALAVDFNRRCSSLYAEVRQVVLSGELGRVRSLSYVNRRKLSMKGAHYIDLANWLAGSEPVWVTGKLADVSTWDHRGAFFHDPPGTVEVTYENGVRFVLDGLGSSGLPAGFTAGCEGGEVRVDVAESGARVLAPGGERKHPSDKRAGGYNWFENTLEGLLAPGERFTPCPLCDATSCLAITVAAHVSSRRGAEPVRLPLERESAEEPLRIA